jgi:hypothetical protein
VQGHQGHVAHDERPIPFRELIQEALHRPAARGGLEKPDVQHGRRIAKRIWSRKRPADSEAAQEAESSTFKRSILSGA